MTEKFCIHCKDTLPVSAFSLDKRRLDGYSPYCRTCRSKIRVNENRDPEKARLVRRKHYEANIEYYRGFEKTLERVNPKRARHKERQASDPDYREEAKRRARESYDRKPREVIRAQSRHWRATNPERARVTSRSLHLRKTYGVTLEEYDAMVALQNGLCAICGMPPIKGHKKLVIDHCHSSGKVRGLLCGLCNTAIGAMRDDVEVMAKAIEYLKSHKS